ncbi:MAG: hypothetical protein FWD06_09750 [Oscillospiraceae bacterium]|nr:hypothetical protein [Oscillospiraceae bacterium]
MSNIAIGLWIAAVALPLLGILGYLITSAVGGMYDGFIWLTVFFLIPIAAVLAVFGAIVQVFAWVLR